MEQLGMSISNVGDAATKINEITSTMNKVLLCTFGVGLSYGSAILDFSDLKNYGISTYQALRKNLTREEQIKYWINKFMGENNDW